MTITQKLEHYFTNVKSEDIFIKLEEIHYFYNPDTKNDYCLKTVQEIKIYFNGSVEITRNNKVAYTATIPLKDIEKLKEYVKTLPFIKNDAIAMQPNMEHIVCSATVYFDKDIFTKYANSFDKIYPTILGFIKKNSNLVNEQLCFSTYVWQFMK